MAEGKDKLSFLLYKNQRVMFDRLTDEQAGKLIKLIFQFVNCENPKETDDAMVNYGFAMLKSTLEIDLERWKDISKKRSEAGRKGREASISKEKQMQANDSNSQQMQADKDKDNDKDNDNGNEKDKVNDNLSSKESESKEKAADESSACTLTPEQPKSDPKKTKHKYGEYQQVQLTDDEYSRLCGEFGTGYIKAVIAALDESKKMTGNKNKWKEDNLVIRKAIREQWSLIKDLVPAVENNKSHEDEEEEEIDFSGIELEV